MTFEAQRKSMLCFLKIDFSLMRCYLFHLSALPLPRALHIRSVVGHLISCYRISKFPPTASKGSSSSGCRGASARLMFTLIAQSPCHLKKKQINVEKKQAATMALPQCFFSTISSKHLSRRLPCDYVPISCLWFCVPHHK